MGVRLTVVPAGAAQGNFRLAVVSGGRAKFSAFLRYCEEKSTVSSADAEAVLRLAADWIVASAREGRGCDLGPLGGSRLGVKGTFDKYPKYISDNDFALTVAMMLHPEIKKAVRAAGHEELRERTVSRGQGPFISYVHGFIDTAADWVEDHWQAGGVLHLLGGRLKFDRQREDEGVFFTAKGSKKSHRATMYLDVFPKNVRAIVPQELAGAGELSVQIRRRRRPQDKHLVTASHAGLIERPS